MTSCFSVISWNFTLHANAISTVLAQLKHMFQLYTCWLPCVLYVYYPYLLGSPQKKDTNQWTFDPFQWILSHWIKFQTLNKRRLTTCFQMYVFFWYLPKNKLAQCVPFYSTFGVQPVCQKNMFVLYFILYTTLHLGVSKNRGTPKWMVYNGKPYFLMDDLGGKPTIFGNLHLYKWQRQNSLGIPNAKKKAVWPCWSATFASARAFLKIITHRIHGTIVYLPTFTIKINQM